VQDGIIKCKHSYICDYHTTKPYTREGLWRIERDCSLENGAEFISPPQKLEQAIKTMRVFSNAVKEHGSTTSHRCGCHINMSLTNRGKILKIDEDELLTNINWRLLSFLWGTRLIRTNLYCKNLNSIFTQIKSCTFNVCNSMSNKSGIGNELFTKLNGCIIKKDSLISNKGVYYELRFPGGVNYHKYPDKIEQTIRHFSEILEKSRKSSCNNKKINKKIVSYINRLYVVNFSWTELLKRKTVLIPTIKTFANGYQKATEYPYPTKQDHKIRSLTNSITNMILNKVGIFSEKDIAKVRSVVCKNHLFYYFLKYAFFNYSKNKDYISFNPLLNFKNMAIDLTIPKEESDFDKLWLAAVYSIMTEKEKVHIIKSIKSNKAKIIFKKMTKDNIYKTKIINAQRSKKKTTNY
jgi:hypothetical protein